jgi:hypothetical protein
VQTRCGKIGDTGEDVGEPGLGIDVVEATSRDHRQHDGGTVGATLAAGEGPVAPSQCDTSQCALSTIVGQADPAIVEEAGEVAPAPEHVVDRLQDLGGAREGFALTQQPGVHVLEKRLALFLAHGAPLVGAAAVDGMIQMAGQPSGAEPLKVSYADLGGRFGVSRTHVRKLLEDAEELDLVRLTQGGGQFVELLPPVLQAFDRLVAEAISGLDLCYQLALRRP